MRSRFTSGFCRAAAGLGLGLVATVASAQARRTAPPNTVLGPGQRAVARATAPGALPRIADRSAHLLRADQPDRDVTNPDPTTGDPSIVHGYAAGQNVNGLNLSGVARLSIATSIGNFACTGTLIGPRTLLTAAHCVTDDLTGSVITARNGVTARFYGPNGFVDYTSSAVVASPFWQGFFNPFSFGGDDVAIVHFDTVAEPWMQQYDLFLGNPFFQTATEVGYGVYGNGTQGPVGFDGRRRWGQNRIDYLSIDGVLWSDFDNGVVANDAWCWADGYSAGSPFCDTGYGAFESALGGGDSGGPMFVGNQIAGVASFGTYFCDPTNANTCVPGSPPLLDADVPFGYGHLNGHAWVGLNDAWINGQVAAIPEPSTIVLVGGGLMVLVGVVRRRRIS